MTATAVRGWTSGVAAVAAGAPVVGVAALAFAAGAVVAPGWACCRRAHAKTAHGAGDSTGATGAPVPGAWTVSPNVPETNFTSWPADAGDDVVCAETGIAVTAVLGAAAVDKVALTVSWPVAVSGAMRGALSSDDRLGRAGFDVG
ncbi:hypothetical protein [Mycolicibacterium llatzerense]|uniref:hypothetical protein n=1 Tax=Mycolicibacterium llatzerense TaxID=280871 RepID=UPI0013A6B88A|nr:hypothetical protein [Mycolicibacterium llatzerense]